MASSFVKLGAAALAYAAGVAATDSPLSYQLADSYNSGNFFDKFNFFTGADPNNGFVNYRTKADALDLGLIQTQDKEVFIGVDNQSPSAGESITARNSVRIESEDRYNSGLFIAKFSHFPKPVCGAWPAFWMMGETWPDGGEIDIYEMWNQVPHNQITLHTGDPDDVGVCTIDQSLFSGSVVTRNCDVNALGQYFNQGCGAEEKNGQWGKNSGGVYATEWQEDRIRVWSWPYGAEPEDVKDGSPDPATWGRPHFAVGPETCNIPGAFKDLRIILNINFCGDAAGNDGIWGQTTTPGTCAHKTGKTCNTWVRDNPDEFNEVFWRVEYINVFQLDTAPTPSSSSYAASSTVYSASSSIVSSASASSAVVSSSSYAASSSAVSSSASYGASVSSYSTSVSSYSTSVSSYSASVPSYSASVSSYSASVSSYSASVSSAPSYSASVSSYLPSESDDCDDEEPSSTVYSSYVPSSSAVSSYLPSESDDCDDDEPSSTIYSSYVPSSSAASSYAPSSSALSSYAPGSSGYSSYVPSSSVVSSYAPSSTEDCDDEEPTSSAYLSYSPSVSVSSGAPYPPASSGYPSGSVSSGLPVPSSSDETPCSSTADYPISTASSDEYPAPTYPTSPSDDDNGYPGGDDVPTSAYEPVPTYTTDTTTVEATTTKYLPVPESSGGAGAGGHPGYYPSGGPGNGNGGGYPAYPGANTTVSVVTKPAAPAYPTTFTETYAAPGASESVVVAGGSRTGVVGAAVMAGGVVVGVMGLFL